MRNIIYHSVFRFCRFCARCFTPRYRVCPPNVTVTPVVYVVHHQNLRGPIISMVWFNKPIRPWVLSVFCDQNTCFRQFYDYTFTKRFRMPKVIAAVIAFPLSFCVSGLMHWIRAIPVFRGSKAIVKTFRQSISALTEGQSLLICPDIEYTDTGSSMNEMYHGFLDLEKNYRKQTNRHLAFVPLHISESKHCIHIGEAIYFNTVDDIRSEKIRVFDRLKQEFSCLVSSK